MTLGQTWFLTLIQPGSQEAARSLVDSATERGGLDHAIAWTWDDLARIEAIDAHPFVLADGLRDLELWKPALIRAQLDLTAPGDSLLYHDAGTGYWGDHRLEVPMAPLLNWAACNNNGMLPGVWVPELGPNRRWASQDCFRTMGCNSQTFWDSPQLQTTYSLWRNDSASIEVLDAWWTACLSVYSQDGADAQELGEFVADRGSQSVLTNLALARGLRTFGEPHERTSVVNHPAIASVPATDIENLINRIRDETEPAPASPADAGSISAGPPARCALFTSIPPEAKRHTTNGIPIGRAYQERCIASWLACGFEVFSVHYRDENALDEPIDGIIRIEVDREEDDPPEEFKPSIRAMLRAVEQVGADVSGLINADIVLVDAPPWIDVVSPQVSGSAVLFSRLDTRDIDRQILGGPPWGFDLILFDRKYIPSLSYCGMRIGECWWDYWFPLAMHFAGAEVKHVTDFLCLHQEHPLVSNAKYDEYGRKIFTWIGALGAGEIVSAKSELSRDFVDFCIHRLRVRSKDDGLVNLGAYEGSFSYIVWSALCRLMRRNPIALIEKNNPHHRFVSRTLGKIVDFIGEKRAHGELWDVLSPGPDHELLRAELASFLPDWQQRLAELTNYGSSESEVHYPADAGDAVQRSSDYRLISIVNNLHRYWPVAVDFRLRNFFRRIRGRGHYSPPIHDSARSATLWLRDVRYRFLTRNLARLDRVFRPAHPTQDHNQ